MLEELLKQQESKTLEFKENAKSLDPILHSTIAFGNTSGGIIVIGIKDKTKEVVGVKKALDEEIRIANCIADSISPAIFPDIYIHSWKKKEVLIIKVSHGVGPYHLKSKGEIKGTYLRLGSSNRRVDESALAELKRMSSNQSFDEIPSDKSKLDDFDMDAAKAWFAKVKKTFNQNKATSLKLFVKKQAKIVPTIGGMLLFGKTKDSVFPDAVVRCVLFAGTTKAKVLDHQEIQTHLPNTLDLVLKFIYRNTRTKAKFGNMMREDVPDYPTEVVREAVVNALLHADYSVKGSSIMVAIFDDRIEISNPGALPFGLTMENAIEGMSQLRNRVLGRVFKELRLIEQWGSGLGRMIGECKRLGLKQPKFEEVGYFFRCTLFSEKASELVLEIWEEALLRHLKEDSKVKAKDLRGFWNVSKRTARTRIKKMVEDGKVVEFASSPFDPTKWYALPKGVDT